MTNQRDNIIIAEHGTITQEALLAYLNDELPVEQRQQLEHLLKSDPFSQDALEGLRNAQDKGAVFSTLISIRKRVNERIGKREKRIIPFHWSNYAYVAVILGLLISVAFILTTYFNKRHEDTAINKTNEQNVVVPQQQEIKQAPPVVPATSPDTVTTSPVPTGTAAKEIISEDKTKKTGAANNADNVSPTVSVSNNATKGEQMTSSSNKVTEQNAVANNNANADAASAPQLSDNDAHKSFFSGDYKKSEAQYDSVLQKQPDNSDALFFGGISDYVNGNLDKAEKNFGKLLEKNKRYVDGSKWYKANILLKKGQKDAGVNLLQELSHTKGSYKERAQKKLTELQ